ncbi:periphilin-1 isoform X2 [Mugil cephalus]|uniref:periphilin-1 isoform X2 n=1 Tax=Mugil cephalus TaxID=48193 RepID=UPI001FB7BA09|nr:periphilin-1 isoform X2 [Mugil cephalus]
MDHARAPDTQENKSYREHSDDSVKRSTDSTVSTNEEEKRPFRRVPSPSIPRAWMSSSYKPKFGGRFYKPRDDHPFYSKHRYHNPRSHDYRRDPIHPKLHHIAVKEREREREREREKERHEQRDRSEGNSPPKQSSGSRPFLPKFISSRDKDMQFTSESTDRGLFPKAVYQSDWSQGRDRDHRGTSSRDRELPSVVSQTVARDRAIQKKRREIDEVYYQECEIFGLVVKMLIAKDPSLERPIQSSLQENLRDIGQRCVEAMEKFIEDYDSRELSH